MIEKSIFKIICISSLITGAILGVLPLIPFFTFLAFIIVMCFNSPFIIIYLCRLNLLNNLTFQKSLFVGFISGFFSFIGFSVVYFPIALILYLIFKINSFLYIKVLFANFAFLVPMIILTALLCGLVNMFSAFLTLYIQEYVKTLTQDKNRR